MKKRQFIKITGTALTGTVLSPFLSCGPKKEKTMDQSDTTIYTLPDLPYDYSSLEPYIDARTMEIHYSKHHAGYVNKLNEALVGSRFSRMKLEDILSKVGPDDTAIRNNGGGHYNHSLFWTIMNPRGGGEPGGEIASAIARDFGSFDQFMVDFSNTAGSVFGSGWAWLCSGRNQALFITSTPNQDNPLMTLLVEEGGIPILGIDVWEHAYYLKYQNRRAEYIANFFNVIYWEEVNRRYLESQ